MWRNRLPDGSPVPSLNLLVVWAKTSLCGLVFVFVLCLGQYGLVVIGLASGLVWFWFTIYVGQSSLAPIVSSQQPYGLIGIPLAA